jgi:hypothetical protein
MALEKQMASLKKILGDDEDDNFQLTQQIKQALYAQSLEEAHQKLDLMLENMHINHEMDCDKFLRKQMYYILLCKYFPERINSESLYTEVWKNEYEIAYLMLINPKINREYLESSWERCLKYANERIEFDGIKEFSQLSWEDVFEGGYLLFERD